MARSRYNTKPDEHPRPHIDIPFSVVGSIPFSQDERGFALLGRFVQLWCQAVWKKDPTFNSRDWPPEVVELFIDSGYITRRRGKLFHTGPNQDKNWLLDTTKKFSTYAVVAESGCGKVGKALDILKRIETLQIGSAERLNLTHTSPSDIERAVHTALRGHWMHGEWFILNDESRAILDLMMERVHG